VVPAPTPRTEVKLLKLLPDLTDQTNTDTLHSNEYGFFVAPADVRTLQHSVLLCSACGFTVDVKRRTFGWTNTETWLIESLKYHSLPRGIFIKTELYLPEFCARSVGVPVELMTDVI
jgi:hypothetical protein